MKCGALCRTVLRLCVILLIAYGIHLLMNGLTSLVPAGDDRLRIGMVIAFLLAYAVLISIPFVPGIEIGLSLMIMEGPWIAPFIYMSTVAGLSLAYIVGEWVPYARLHRILQDLRLQKMCSLLEAVEPLSRAERLQALEARAPTWLRPLTKRYRYVLLGILLNLPGNAVLGGGGGILFTAGFSRLFPKVQTLLTIAIAVAPVPLVVWAFDLGSLLD